MPCGSFRCASSGACVPRLLVCVAIGTVGGLVGGVVGQFLFDECENLAAFQIFGWVLTGLMVGVSIGSYDFLRGWVREEELAFAPAKVLRGVLGGTVGGLLGRHPGLETGRRLGRASFPARTICGVPA